jgi:hypothetical protein
MYSPGIDRTVGWSSIPYKRDERGQLVPTIAPKSPRTELGAVVQKGQRDISSWIPAHHYSQKKLPGAHTTAV